MKNLGRVNYVQHWKPGNPNSEGECRRRIPIAQSEHLLKKNTQTLSIITWNTNEYHKPMKRHGLNDWIHKQDPSIGSLYETYLLSKDV